MATNSPGTDIDFKQLRPGHNDRQSQDSSRAAFLAVRLANRQKDGHSRYWPLLFLVRFVRPTAGLVRTLQKFLTAVP